MKTRNTRTILIGAVMALAVLAIAIPSSSLQGPTSHNQVECESRSTHVKAVTAPDFHIITTRFQFPPGSLEPLLGTTVIVGGRRPSCLVAHLSAITRVTDNYIVFQVRVDGVPMQGHLSSFAGIATPVVMENKFAIAPRETEREMSAYNFFATVGPGPHLVEVLVAAGSGIDPSNPPQVGSPTLTLEYVGGGN